jgi:hypothetical protein
MTSGFARFSNLVLVAAVSSQLALPAFADASVRLGGAPVFSVPASSGGLTPDQRAKAMQKNRDNALVASTNRSPSAVGVTYVSGQPVLTLGGFYVCTVDAVSARKLGLTPGTLATRWQTNLRNAMRNRAAVDSYVSALTSSPKTAVAGTTTTQAGSYPFYRQGHVVYIPAGMTMPVSLSTAVSSVTARVGDKIEAKLAEDINMGDATVPAGSVLIGTVTDAVPGQRLDKSGSLGLKFTLLRTPDGAETPITAHIIGGLEKYDPVSAENGLYKGEGTKKKVEQAALRGAIGAGAGALLGTTIGAISSHGYGTGRGAVAGTLFGAGLGVADALLLRKGADVSVGSGQMLKLQLDAPASLALSNASGM